MNFFQLPPECQLVILSHIDRNRLLQLLTLNRHFNIICLDNSLWKRLVYQDYGSSDETWCESWYVS